MVHEPLKILQKHEIYLRTFTVLFDRLKGGLAGFKALLLEFTDSKSKQNYKSTLDFLDDVDYLR